MTWLKPMLRFSREISALFLTIYTVWIGFGGAQVPANPMVGMFQTALIFGAYTWIQDLGGATDKQHSAGRAVVEIIVSAFPLLVAAYALLPHGDPVPLGEFNFYVLWLVIVFCGKDVVVGLFYLFKILLLTDDVKVVGGNK